MEVRSEAEPSSSRGKTAKNAQIESESVSANPPHVREHHVRVPDQVAKLLMAEEAHRRGFTGKGIRIAVIDSGFFPHPYYTSRGYVIRYVPTRHEPKPYVDQYGHGTAQLASLFALAPHAEALAIKCMDWDPSAAIEKAISLRPQILSCAWGFNIDGGPSELPPEYHKMHALLRKATELGILVVSAAGNGQYSFPGSMPEVLSVGGVYYSPCGGFFSSDVSSRYESTLFPNRQVPDICGLAGNRPHGRLLLVPVPPKAKLAKRASFSSGADQGGNGWAIFSGTSAATAMVSGAAAILLQARPDLKVQQLRQILVETARQTPDSGCRVLTIDAALERALSI